MTESGAPSTPRRSGGRTCHLCGREISAGYDLLGGPICNPCYSRLRRHPATCPSCGHTKVLAFHNDSGDIVCAACAGVPARFACKSCGSEEQLTGSHCGPCRLADRARSVLSREDDTLHPDLVSLYTHLLSAPDKRSVTRWLSKEPIAAMLRAMASGQVPISHEGVNRFPQSRRVNYFRQLLISSGTLPPIDVRLNEFEIYAKSFLSAIPPSNAAILGRYHRWHVLRRLRQQSMLEPLSQSVLDKRRGELRAFSGFLSWVDRQGVSLATINQAHIDYFVANVGTGNNALRAFVSWACANGHAIGIEVPINKRFSPAAAMSADELWQAVDHLLVDETIEMAARVAGLFILLYAQPLADCVRLRRSDVVFTDQGVAVRFASEPIQLPDPVAKLVRRYVEMPSGRAIYRNSETNWLFGGLLPSSRVTEAHLGKIVASAGVPPRLAKEAAMRQLATSLPARVVADAIGVSVGTASKWSRTSGGTWNDYPGLR